MFKNIVEARKGLGTFGFYGIYPGYFIKLDIQQINNIIDGIEQGKDVKELSYHNKLLPNLESYGGSTKIYKLAKYL